LLLASLPLLLVLEPRLVLIQRLLEAGVYTTLLLILLSHRPFRAVLFSIGRPKLVLLGGFVLLAVFAQLVKVTGLTYPFAAWNMYADAAPTPEYVHHEAVLASDEKMAFPFERVTPTDSSAAFAHSFKKRARSLAAMAQGDPTKAAKAAELRGLLSEVAALYNRRYPADPIREMRVSICQVPLKGYTGPSSVACQGVISASVGE